MDFSMLPDWSVLALKIFGFGAVLWLLRGLNQLWVQTPLEAQRRRWEQLKMLIEERGGYRPRKDPYGTGYYRYIHFDKNGVVRSREDIVALTLALDRLVSVERHLYNVWQLPSWRPCLASSCLFRQIDAGIQEALAALGFEQLTWFLDPPAERLDDLLGSHGRRLRPIW